MNSLKTWVKKPVCYKVETNPVAKKREEKNKVTDQLDQFLW